MRDSRLAIQWSCIVAVMLASSLAVQSQPATPSAPGLARVRAELVADVPAITPGASFRVGVRLSMSPGWHVNWINPGDAGLAPSIAWKLPDGFKVGIVQWPFPSRFATGPLTIFGYADQVLLMADVRAPESLSPGGNLELAADVSWLACAQECVPGSASVRLSLPVEATSRAHLERAEFEATEARLPRRAMAWNVDARIEESTTLVLDIQNGAATGAPLEGVFFFPYDPGLIENAAAQTMSVHAGPRGESVHQLRVTRARIPAGAMTQVQGVLVAASGLVANPGPAAIEISVPVHR
jgi:thiol:disulfide interchange protein DsbD